MGSIYAGLLAGLDMWPPRIDITTHEIDALGMRAKVVADRATAAGCRGGDDRNAQSMQNPRGTCIDLRCNGGLDAAFKQQYATLVLRRRARWRIVARRDFALDGGRQQCAHGLPDAQQWCETPRIRNERAQRAAQQALQHGSADALFNKVTADIDQAAITHTRGTGRFTRTAGQAAVQM